MEVRICNTGVAALFLSTMGFLLRQSLKGVYDITGRGIGYHSSIAFR